MKNNKLLVWILAIALVAALIYIGLGFWQTKQLRQMQQTFQLGYQQGLTDTVAALYQQTTNCQAAVITIGNVTRQVIDVACLKPGT